MSILRRLSKIWRTPKVTDNNKSIIHKISNYQKPRIDDLTMDQWRQAVNAAESPILPRRNQLYKLYHTVMDDEFLLTQVRTAIFTVQMAPFEIMVDGQANEELKALFTVPWFDHYLKYAVEAELYGHSLIEFNPKMVDGQFKEVVLMPRNWIRPEYGEVVWDVSDVEGENYREQSYSKYLIEIGQPLDLGLLKSASRVVILSRYSKAYWSQRNARYGMPHLIVQTSTQDDKELNKKAEMAENLGAAGWAILDDGDEIKLSESSQAFAYQTYKDLIKDSKNWIAELINGQSGTTEMKAFAGAAEVQERVMNSYTKRRLKVRQYDINTDLIPLLVRHGYPLENATFEFTDLRDSEDMPDITDHKENGGVKTQMIHLKKKAWY